MIAATDLDLIECSHCGDMQADLYEALTGELFCADCMDYYAPQLVPAPARRRPTIDVHLP